MLRFGQGDMIRHKNCIDIDLHVVKVQYRGPIYYKLKVIYVNRHNGITYNWQAETVKIYRKDFKHWSFVNGTI